MGNMIPDICVCKERDGKSANKRPIKYMFYDENIKIIDYVGVTHPSRSLTELSVILRKFIPYELTCFHDSNLEKMHSVVKIKCFSFIDNLGICFKIVYLTVGKFIIYVIPIWEEDDDKVILDQEFHNQALKNDVRNN